MRKLIDLEDKCLDKLKYIAKEEGRTVKNLIERMVKTHPLMNKTLE